MRWIISAMQKLQNIFKRLLAALTFFTRLPLWRLCNIPAEHYRRVVPLWPLAGWVTGGMMATVFLLADMLFPCSIAVVIALISRILLTGALHEDGFADFCDGFGGGTSRERILAIMKDSHIGTYGVLGLLLYLLLISASLYEWFSGCTPTGSSSLPFRVWMIVCIDAWCKYCASRIIYHLPYARRAEEAKNKLVYAETGLAEKVMSLMLGLLPLVPVFCAAAGSKPSICLLAIVILIPLIVSTLMFSYIRSRLQGYTGDCCGAVFVVCEVMTYLFLSTLSF